MKVSRFWQINMPSSFVMNRTQGLFCCLLLCELIAVLNHFGFQKLAVVLTIVRFLVHKYKFILNSSSHGMSRHFPKACLNTYSFEASGRGCHGLDSFKFEPR